jgi:hypothetical protein
LSSALFQRNQSRLTVLPLARRSWNCWNTLSSSSGRGHRSSGLFCRPISRPRSISSSRAGHFDAVFLGTPVNRSISAQVGFLFASYPSSGTGTTSVLFKWSISMRFLLVYDFRHWASLGRPQSGTRCAPLMTRPLVTLSPTATLPGPGLISDPIFTDLLGEVTMSSPWSPLPHFFLRFCCHSPHRGPERSALAIYSIYSTVLRR